MSQFKREKGYIGKRELLVLMPMELKEFLEVFSKFYKPSFKNYSIYGTINLFYIDSTDSIKSILREFKKLGLITEDFISKLISNKSKPLIVDARTSINMLNYDDHSFEISIYQPRAKGMVIKCFFPLSIVKDYENNQLFCILYYFFLSIKKDLNIESLKEKKIKTEMDLKNKLSLLDEEELRIYYGRKRITEKEKNQVLYTYYLYKKQYDFTTEYIDDNKQKAKADAENAKIKTILDLCEKVAKKFGFELKTQEATE